MVESTRISSAHKATVESAIVNNGLQGREFPEFSTDEIFLGPVLGKGAFGIVHEVERFGLQGNLEDVVTSDEKEEKDDEGKDEEEDEEDPDNTHYKITSAKQFMADNVLRNGKDARYALKKLKKKIESESASTRDRAMMDMAIEARILSMLWHPNIIKMRGRGRYLQPDCFIVLDRLYDTLAQRVTQWRKLHTIFAKRAIKERVQGERLAVAYDVSSAFKYLRQHQIVYRDVKQENMGFDVRGDIKLFDFGLAKSLGGARGVDSGYLLTPRTGTIPYMAPEVVLAHPYTTQCDVYSLAILFYELWSTRNAFTGVSATEYTNRCILQGQRPSPIPRIMPPRLRALLPAAWDANPQQRATVYRVFEASAAEWYSTEKSSDRDAHMRDKSLRSQRLLMLQKKQRMNLV